jgi:hypothetical protein
MLYLERFYSTLKMNSCALSPFFIAISKNASSSYWRDSPYSLLTASLNYCQSSNSRLLTASHVAWPSRSGARLSSYSLPSVSLVNFGLIPSTTLSAREKKSARSCYTGKALWVPNVPHKAVVISFCKDSGTPLLRSVAQMPPLAALTAGVS